MCGKRNLEIVSVVPGCYIVNTGCKKLTNTHSKRLKDMKERYLYFDFELRQDAISKPKFKKAC